MKTILFRFWFVAMGLVFFIPSWFIDDGAWLAVGGLILLAFIVTGAAIEEKSEL